MPRVTVVLPVYNHQNYVEAALRSVFAQDYPDFQIVAVDDGSTDSSLDVLDRHASRVNIIRSVHRGPAAARNRALAATDSEFVAFMDADDLCAPGRLRLGVEKLESENLDLISSALSFIDSSGQSVPGAWTCPPNARNDYWGALLERNWIGTPSVMLRRRVLDSLGLFDETFTHAEDYDLWLRIGRSHAIGYLETPLIQCRRHSANTSINIASHQHFERMALQKVEPSEAWKAFDRLHPAAADRDEAWIWFLLRSGSAAFVEELRLALARNPLSRTLRFALGVFQYDSGLYEESRQTFQGMKDLDAACLHNAGVLSAQCGDFHAAASYLRDALRLLPGYHDAQYNLAALDEQRDLRLTRRPFRENPVPMVVTGANVVFGHSSPRE